MSRLFGFDAIILQNERMGTSCLIIGVRKDIRKQNGKTFGDMVHITICERRKQKQTMSELKEILSERISGSLRL